MGGATTFASAKVKNAIGRIGIFPLQTALNLDYSLYVSKKHSHVFNKEGRVQLISTFHVFLQPIYMIQQFPDHSAEEKKQYKDVLSYFYLMLYAMYAPKIRPFLYIFISKPSFENLRDVFTKCSEIITKVYRRIRLFGPGGCPPPREAYAHARDTWSKNAPQIFKKQSNNIQMIQ